MFGYIGWLMVLIGLCCLLFRVLVLGSGFGFWFWMVGFGFVDFGSLWVWGLPSS